MSPSSTSEDLFKAADAVSSPPPLRILHLEDCSHDASIIAWTLRTAGISCRITRVEDEATYVEALRHSEFDLILSDSNVPGLSGITALAMARVANVRAPFIFVSGAVSAETRAYALRLGASDCLLKEHRAQLIFTVQRIWQQKQQSFAC